MKFPRLSSLFHSTPDAAPVTRTVESAPARAVAAPVAHGTPQELEVARNTVRDALQAAGAPPSELTRFQDALLTQPLDQVLASVRHASKPDAFDQRWLSLEARQRPATPAHFGHSFSQAGLFVPEKLEALEQQIFTDQFRSLLWFLKTPAAKGQPTQIADQLLANASQAERHARTLPPHIASSTAAGAAAIRAAVDVLRAEGRIR